MMFPISTKLSRIPTITGLFQRSQRLMLALVWVFTLMLAAPLNDVAFAREMSDETTTNSEKESKKKEAKETTDTKAEAKTNSAEMVKIEALEERIRVLEEKLARLGGEAPALVANAGTPKAGSEVEPVVAGKADAIDEVRKDVQEMKEEAKKNESFFNFFRSVEVSGVVDGYYGYNNNEVDMQGRAFDFRNNAFSLQLAKLTLERKNSKESPLGFRVDLGLGDTVDRVISISDSSRNDATKHVLQAYASYVAPVGSGLTFDFGKFYTPVGAEVIETKDNFNYSRGLLFLYGPFYHAGLRTKYAVNDKVALTGFLVNGWDNLFENNFDQRSTGKTIGLQLGLTPTKKFALTGTYLGGNEAPLANVPAPSLRDNWRNIFDSVATYYLTDKLTLLGNFVYGNDGDNLGNRGYWTGFAGYLKYAFTKNLAFSPRFEVFNDHAGLRSGTPQTLKDITLTQEVKLLNNFLTRFEYRRDFSNQPFFSNFDLQSRKNQNTFLIGLSYFFTTKE
jgi:putative OmpL-like beta-barrel porin-2